MMKPCYQLLAVAYDKKNDYKNALHYAELYSNLNDSVMNTENAKVITEMQARFETEKKEKAIELLRKDKNIRELHMGQQEANIHRQRIIIYSVIGGLILIIVLIFFIWKSYREKKKIHIGLERKNTEINVQKNLIEEKNIFITDSIDSARNIQNAILPPDEIISKHIPDSFIFFMPKDIVSGDFYWMSTPTAGCVLLASIDCTGHGVPGAFMSVMAFNMLENIIADKKLSQPSLILDELNKTVLETLHQETENSSAKYGMDISLISINKNEIQFAGAHNSLLIVNTKDSFFPEGEIPKAEGAVIELKADKVTIGMATEKFTNHTIEAQKGDMLYMFTDGYPDQKGGPQNKKFFSGEFKNMLASLSQKNTPEQKEILQKTFSDWKGNNEQIDDVLVIGIRI
jgi:serine phosphatase RsbU (regulator of sigma subunit)